MKRAQLILRGLLLVLIFVGPVYTQRDPPTSEFQLKSELLGRTIGYQILYPVKYEYPENRGKRFPVVYLLHGLTGHSTNWLEKTKIALYATHYDFFIVMVEGGNGWYTDSATVPADKYESYILRELIPDVEKRFRVSTQREGRAIAGLSMGGYGAIKFGLKYPEMFAMAASMSGAFGAASWTEKELKDPGVIRDSVLQAFGPAESPTRAANDIFKLAREVAAKKTTPLPYLYFDCGIEDFIFDESRALARLFLELKIPHEYRQLPGTHSWTYWDAQVQEILKLAAKRLQHVTQTVSLRKTDALLSNGHDCTLGTL
ncbi:MAG: esterase family protein [Acidobacteriota bacterium]|nr:esterase family protein [Acidobacteriota bacterium]